MPQLPEVHYHYLCTSNQVIEWFAEGYKKFGCSLEFVTNKSPEGSQFVKGFGGIGGLLRYPVDLVQLQELEDGNIPGGDAMAINDDDDFDEDDFM